MYVYYELPKKTLIACRKINMIMLGTRKLSFFNIRKCQPNNIYASYILNVKFCHIFVDGKTEAGCLVQGLTACGKAGMQIRAVCFQNLCSWLPASCISLPAGNSVVITDGAQGTQIRRRFLFKIGDSDCLEYLYINHFMDKCCLTKLTDSWG